MKIFLDDDPVRDSWVDDTWTIERDPLRVLSLCYQGKVEELSLDHDLGEDQPTGYRLARELEYCAFSGWWDCVPKKITIHSANSVGRKNIQAAIDSIERMRNG